MTSKPKTSKPFVWVPTSVIRNHEKRAKDTKAANKDGGNADGKSKPTQNSDGESQAISNQAGPAQDDPKTFQSWVIGALSGGAQSWMRQYVETQYFEEARLKLLARTGFDARYLIAGVVAIRTGRQVVPWLAEQFRTQMTSSVTVDQSHQDPFHNALLQFIAEQGDSTSTSWFKLGGEHTDFRTGFEYTTSKNSSRFFWYNGVLILVEKIVTTEQLSAPVQSEYDANYDGQDQENYQWEEPARKIVLSCLGRSNEPIIQLINFVRERELKKNNLVVTNHRVGGATRMFRPKRPLSSIDMDPDKADEIRKDATKFFHKSSHSFYHSTGTPFRRGYLLSGPPGTGKTSLSVALASDQNVPLVIIHLAGMDDNDLDKAFSDLPERCVALSEDIDSAGVYREQGPQDEEEEHDDEQEQEIKKTDFFGEYFEQKAKRNTSGEQNRVTLSGLLNAIDGASAKEGRLLIMTTNAPRSLDPALYRPGRVDKIIEMGYSTKVTAELCFKRIFSNDPRKTFSDEAVSRFAKAFAAQFPRKSKITGAELAVYCMNYRGDPVNAVKDFGEYLRKLRTGENAFKYDINDDVPDEPDENYNLEETYDPELLQFSSEDVIEYDDEPRESEQKVEKKQPQDPWWSFLFFDSEVVHGTPHGDIKEDEEPEDSKQTVADKPGKMWWTSVLFGERLAPETPTGTALNTARADMVRVYWETYPFIKPRASRLLS